MALSRNRVEFALLLFVCLFLGSYLDLGTGHQCQGDHHHHHHDHAHSHSHLHQDKEEFVVRSKLPEELAEEEDMKLYGFGLPHDHHHDHDHHHSIESTELSGLGILSNFALVFFSIRFLCFFGCKLSSFCVDLKHSAV